MKIDRRTFAKGAAWSAPVIAATATVPAYAASLCPDITTSTQYTSNSVGEEQVIITFTGQRAWGEARLAVTGAALLDPAPGMEVSHLDSLTVLIQPTGDWSVTLHPAGCDPVTVAPAQNSADL